jgi:hypothetical protein
MKRRPSTLSLGVLLCRLIALLITLLLWPATQVTAAEPTGAQPSSAPSTDFGRQAIGARKPVESNPVVRADPSQDADDSPRAQDDSQKAQDTPRCYRPLCGPSEQAINHVYCAPGYDSW